MARPRIRPTLYLFQLIEAKAQRDQTTRDELCRRFGISSSYYGQLSSEAALLSQASRPVIAAVAAYLDVPFVQVQLWSGQLDWQDFGPPRNPGAAVVQYLDNIALQLEHDPEFREFAVPLKDWSATPTSIKLRFVALYERARALELQRHADADTTLVRLLARAGNLRSPGNAQRPPEKGMQEPHPTRRQRSA